MWKVVGSRCAGDDDVPARINGNCVAVISRRPTEVGGVKQCMPSRIKFGDKHVGRPGHCGLDSVLEREVQTIGIAGDINVASRVARDGHRRVSAAAGQIGRKNKYRIDDEFQFSVVRPQLKLHRTVMLQHEVGFNDLASSRGLLIRLRLLEEKCVVSEGDHQVTEAIESYCVRTLKCETDFARVSARRDLKIVFHLVVLTMKDQVNSGVDLAIHDLRVVGDSANPVRWITPEQVVASSGKKCPPLGYKIRTDAQEVETNSVATGVFTG